MSMRMGKIKKIVTLLNVGKTPTGPFMIYHSWKYFDSFFKKKKTLNIELPHDTESNFSAFFSKKKKKGKIGPTKETLYRCSEQLYAQ